jgi:glutamine transport system permease protein
VNRNFDLDWSAAIDSMPLFLEGAKLTLLISVVGLFFGFLIGLATGLARTSGNKILSGVSTVYVELIRGTPILVQAIWIYFALPIALGMEIERLTAAIAAIAVNSGAYIAEIVRGSIQSVPKGQVEAGRSLGLNRAQTFLYVVWPQAFRRMIPPLGNQLIISLKDTSILTIIGVAEIVRQAQQVVASNFRAFEVYTTAALLYFAMTLTISLILRGMERRLNVG